MPTVPIVGAFYRPPAKTVLNWLRLRTPLALRAEPDNPADPNAIAVYVRGENVPDNPTIRSELEARNFDLAEIRGRDWVHLGYVPAAQAATLHSNGFPTNRSVAATFIFDVDGNPHARFEIPT